MKPFPFLLLMALVQACQTIPPETSPDRSLHAPDSHVAGAVSPAPAPYTGLLQEPAAPEASAAPEAAAEGSVVEGWSFLLTPYFFAYGLKGTVGTGKSVTDIDADFTDLFDALNFGGMLQFEASPPRSSWTFLADLMYAQIEDDGLTPGPAGVDVHAKIDQFIGELSAAYEVMDEGRLEVLGGVRYWNVSGELEADLPGGKQTANGSADWIDPLVGARSRLALGRQFDLMLRGDLGGFGLGSDFAYNLAAQLGWTLSDAVQIALGYRYMYVDYEDDATFEMTQAGPTLGVAIRL